MDVHVKVVLEGDVPVVVKSASGRAADRLRREHDRLEQARHPGVVALAAGRGAPAEPRQSHDQRPDGEYELRTVYAGEPVSRWAGSLAAIAGVGAAVASTLAELHDVGVVHGRLDSSHILIGDDGRPRLCGLSHPGGAAPADDIAALGAVLDDLVARARPDRRGRLLRPRGAASTRSLRQVIERAADPVATRRPSARNLADAILAAVPLAQLPTGDGRSEADAARRPDASGQGASPPDTLDRIWAFGDQRSDDERWAAAFGGEPLDRPTSRAASPVPDLPMAVVRTSDWSASAPDDFDAADDRGLRRQPDTPFVPWDGAEEALDDHPRRALDDDHLHDPARGDLTRDHHAPAVRVAAARDRRSVGDEEPGGARRRSGGAARSHRVVVVAAGSALAGVALAAGVMLTRSGSGDDASGPDAEAEGSDATCAPVTPPAADVDGDGCPEPLVVEGTTVDAGIAQWSLGEPGDLVALGDWDCDGDASAALLRPGTGDVFVFSAWAPADEPVTVASTRRVDGGVGLRAEAAGDGCDRLVVDLAAGGTTPIEVPR